MQTCLQSHKIQRYIKKIKCCLPVHNATPVQKADCQYDLSRVEPEAAQAIAPSHTTVSREYIPSGTPSCIRLMTAKSSIFISKVYKHPNKTI
jgi:hypothetical protein